MAFETLCKIHLGDGGLLNSLVSSEVLLSVLVVVTSACSGGTKPDLVTSDARPDGGGATACSNPQRTATAESVDGGGQTAALFAIDLTANSVLRYTIKPNADPTLSATIPGVVGGTGFAQGPTGELFVSSYAAASVYRFLSPLGTPTANGVIQNVGLNMPEEMTFVDDELWISSNGSPNMVRLAFDAQGTASVAGIVSSLPAQNSRGMLWISATRDLYLSQCCAGHYVQHLRVAADHSVTRLPAIAADGLAGPHGMVMTSWGELIVAGQCLPDPPHSGCKLEVSGSAAVSGTSLFRFLIDAQGNATPNGVITCNGLAGPVGLALAPWGELFVANLPNETVPPIKGGVSRFTFDASHAAVPNGTFTPMGSPYLSWIKIVP